MARKAMAPVPSESNHTEFFGKAGSLRQTVGIPKSKLQGVPTKNTVLWKPQCRSDRLIDVRKIQRFLKKMF